MASVLSRSVRSLLGLFALLVTFVGSANSALAAGPDLNNVKFQGAVAEVTRRFNNNSVTVDAVGVNNQMVIFVSGKQMAGAALAVTFSVGGVDKDGGAWVTGVTNGWNITVPANELTANTTYNLKVTATGNGGGNGTQTKQFIISPP